MSTHPTTHPAGEPVRPAVPAARLFAHRRILRVQLDAYERAIELLTDAARRRYGPVTATIGIANGGLAPARGISQLLRTPTYQVTAKHNPTDAIYTEATGTVSYDLGPLTSAVDGQQLAGTVLLVDDICGTGATLTALRPDLTTYLGPTVTVRTVALCRNAGSTLDPDLWAWTVDDWVSFPWEPVPPDGTATEDLPIPNQVHPA
ncbi:phosphoribosyltransferase domain-containing protein [Dactylosporangium sp. NBC_01737]|uniref:phosphoribosyltransferase n=1 Tax=Dactylosporangium sp. NBC_01737 TaxID=2975959 RepID=UPI002E117241|nr:phosphoribosyltransferase domain-containing protein [Dactylosporangium sp. NBC_01737]